MPESREVGVATTVVTSAGMERSTRWLLWAVFTAVLILLALLAYGWLTGGLTSTAPRTAEERALAVSADAIKKNPTEGTGYAIRAETLFSLGRQAEAFQVLDQGEKAVKGQNPALLYILRSRTSLLNAQGKFAEAVTVGTRAMSASDDYLARQGAALAAKHVTAIGSNMKTQVSVDTAIQLAAAYEGVKQWDKALTMYNYALKLDPLAADVLAMRGFAYLGAGDKVKAKADFVQSLKFLPDNPDATRGLQQVSK